MRLVPDIIPPLTDERMAAVGGAMIRNFLRPSREPDLNGKAGRLALAIAELTTSRDAAAGISLAMARAGIVTTALLIGAMIFGMASGGVLIEWAAGRLPGRRTELVGGLGPIATGAKILLEYVGR